MPQRPSDPAPAGAIRLDLRTIIIVLAMATGALYLLNGTCAREISRWHLASARERLVHNDFEGAREATAQARSWSASDVEIVLQQVGVLKSQGDIQGALALLNDALDDQRLSATGRLSLLDQQVRLLENQGDIHGVLEVLNDALDDQRLSAAGRLILLEMRSNFLQRLDRHQAAIADADQAVALAERLLSPADTMQRRNNRAYAIARAAAAKRATRDQVLSALAEMRLVFADLHERRRANRPAELDASLELWEYELMYLDTLGYLEYVADKPVPALHNLNRCVYLCQMLLPVVESRARGRGQPGQVKDERQKIAGHLAVILHHRGEVLRSLNNEEDAQRDLDSARQLGYDRKTGVW